jgi:uncharacterized protein YecT (DUF1311 family)
MHADGPSWAFARAPEAPCYSFQVSRMKPVGFWLSAVSALALAACGQARKPGARPAAQAAAVSASATAAPQPVATAAAAQQPGTPSAGEAEAASSSAASGRAVAGPASPAHAVVKAHLTPPAARRDRSAEADDDTDALLADLPGEASDMRAHSYSAAYRACMGSAHGFTAVIADCYSAELVRQGERLNRAFATAVAARSGERKQRLLLAQREWLHLRDSNCQDDDGPDLLHEGSCRLDLTIKRADQLEHSAG